MSNSRRWQKIRKVQRWVGTSRLEVLTLILSVPLILWTLVLAIIHVEGNWKGEHFNLLLDTLGILAGSTVVVVIYTALRAERINRSLVETQMVASKAVTGFRQLFDQHLLKHFRDSIRSDDDELEKVDLILSTPAFGLHPLGQNRCNELIEALRQTNCAVDIVLFTPDAHFPHFLNTILWETRGDGGRADRWQLAFYTAAFMEMVKSGTKSKEWHVWPSNTSDKRMFHFQTVKHTHLYLVLSDDVNLSTDLKEFRGRSLPLPTVLREAIVGGKFSIFEKYQICPFTGKADEEAALSTTHNEFALLLADYLLGRTSQIVHSYPTFTGEVLRAGENQNFSPEQTISWLSRIIRNYLTYLKEIGINNQTKNNQGGWETISISVTGEELARIQSLTKLLTFFTDDDCNITSDVYGKMLSSLSSFVKAEQPIPAVPPQSNAATTEQLATIGQLIDLLYLIARSGMEKSQYVLERRQRVQV